MRVQAQLIDVRWIPNSLRRNLAQQANQDARENAQVIRELMRGKCCDDHPEAPNRVIVCALPSGEIAVEKDFCCEVFEDQFKVSKHSYKHTVRHLPVKSVILSSASR